MFSLQKAHDRICSANGKGTCRIRKTVWPIVAVLVILTILLVCVLEAVGGQRDDLKLVIKPAKPQFLD